MNGKNSSKDFSPAILWLKKLFQAYLLRILTAMVIALFLFPQIADWCKQKRYGEEYMFCFKCENLLGDIILMSETVFTNRMII